MEVLNVTFVGRHVPSTQSLSRHKELHNDLTKPGDICKKGIQCETMDNYTGHSIVSNEAYCC